MLAAWYEEKGAAREVLRLGELPTPEVGAGEVRVRVYASGVNPSDTKRRARPGMEYPRVIPHSDGAGVIDQIGEGVPPSRLGERVWTWNAQFGRPFGTAAEYVTLPSVQAVRLPDKTSFEEGACLGVPCMTAHRCLFADGPVQDHTVLVTGGAGGVGVYAIGLAKWAGATVIATISSAEKARLAQLAGADYTLNYRTENVIDRIMGLTGRRGVDRVVEVAFAANLSVSKSVLKDNGVISTYGSDADTQPRLPFFELLQKGLTVHFVQVYRLPQNARQQAISDIGTCLESGVLRHFITQRFSLNEIVRAHEAVETGHMAGKAVIDLPGIQDAYERG